MTEPELMVSPETDQIVAWKFDRIPAAELVTADFVAHLSEKLKLGDNPLIKWSEVVGVGLSSRFASFHLLVAGTDVCRREWDALSFIQEQTRLQRATESKRDPTTTTTTSPSDSKTTTTPSPDLASLPSIGPAALHFDDSCKHLKLPFFVEEFVEGKTIQHFELHSEATIKEMASLLKWLHSLKQPRPEGRELSKLLYLVDAKTKHCILEGTKKIGPEAHANAVALWQRTIELAAPFLPLLRDPEFKFESLCHGDAHASNTMRRTAGKHKDTLLLIDWESAHTDHPALDLAAYISELMIGPDEVKAFLTAYGWGLKPKEQAFLWLYKLRRYMKVFAFFVHKINSLREIGTPLPYLVAEIAGMHLMKGSWLAALGLPPSREGVGL